MNAAQRASATDSKGAAENRVPGAIVVTLIYAGGLQKIGVGGIAQVVIGGACAEGEARQRVQIKPAAPGILQGGYAREPLGLVADLIAIGIAQAAVMDRQAALAIDRPGSN